MSDEEKALFQPRRSLRSVSEEAVSVIEGAIAMVEVPDGVGVDGSGRFGRLG